MVFLCQFLPKYLTYPNVCAIIKVKQVNIFSNGGSRGREENSVSRLRQALVKSDRRQQRHIDLLVPPLQGRKENTYIKSHRA